ncbi:MAG: hypothetical protein AMK69_18760 [Nitrospira bacterium SG8_3]|nr:MAG: hypothetical protein AMK69_18760 [Nitrospira bacterium SG8_3]
MFFQVRVKQRSPFLLKRARYFLSRFFGVRLQKAKSLHFVTVNGQQFKRLILCDASLASEIEQNLNRFRSTGQFPQVVIRYERELWVDYVTGHPIKNIDERLVEKMAIFYSRLYSDAPVSVQTQKTIFPYRLDRDLHFLNQVGILSDPVVKDVRKTAEIISPPQCWLGFDYTDPVRKNFLVLPENQQICAVDVEGLVKDYLIGMGAAKALIQWMKPFKEQFFRGLALNSAPSFQEYYGFVELCFLAQWTKRAFFEKDWKAVQPKYFEAFRRPEA